MWYRKLGRLGWEVSAISMGTVQFGMPYGFTYDGEAEVPSRNDAVRLLLDAFEAGINLLDTAPTYGAAETIVGEALRQWRGSEIFVATKIPTWGKDPALEVNQSLRRLGRESIDLLQIYSHSDDWDAVLRSLEVALRCLEEGKTRALGISVYDESIALKALDLEQIDTIQLPFSILDQRMAANILPLAARRRVGVLGRSALLKGVLTERRRRLPDQLSELVRRADHLATEFDQLGLGLAAGSLRFCLTNGKVHTILIGARNHSELNVDLGALEARADFERLQEVGGLPASPIVDPRTWKV